MKKVSLTYLIPFVCKSGPPKVTEVRKFKGREEYDPRTDFYKPMRDALVRVFKTGGTLSDLDSWMATVDPKKRAAYDEILTGVRKVIGRKTVEWFNPPKRDYAIGPIVVSVNPELGLVINGKRHIIKVHFKEEDDSEKLNKRRVGLILHILGRALPHDDQTMFSVLDTRRGKLITEEPPEAEASHLDALLEGEAASFAAIYSKV